MQENSALTLALFCFRRGLKIWQVFRTLRPYAERQRVEAHAALADAVGIPAAALTGEKFSFAALSDLPGTVPEEAARRQALLNRPDILGALAEYNASQSVLQLEIAKQYPDIHLNPGYEFDQGDNKWSPGLTVTLPVSILVCSAHQSPP